MPVVEVSMEDTERIPLTTAPPDGYVVLRRMTYDEMLERRDMASKIKLAGNQSQARRRAYGEQTNTSAEILLSNKIVTEWEFQRLVVDHNLTMKDGTPFNFKAPGILRVLHPRVGDEIAHYIGEMNNFEPSLEKQGEGGASADGPLQPDSAQPSSTIARLPARQQT